MPAPEHPVQSATVTPIADRRAARDATGDDPPPSTSDVVTNLSDLTRSMRYVLLLGSRASDEHSTSRQSTLDALTRRGLTTRTDLRPTGRYRLTDAGVRARDALTSVGDVIVTLNQVSTLTVGVYSAVQRTLPMATDLARYVAQLRDWAAHLSDDGDWERGRGSAYAMIADQLERHVLRELAPLLRPEATRRYREGQTRG